jgi:hypothetical protein
MDSRRTPQLHLLRSRPQANLPARFLTRCRFTCRAPQSHASPCVSVKALQDVPGLICLARNRSNHRY